MTWSWGILKPIEPRPGHHHQPAIRVHHTFVGVGAEGDVGLGFAIELFRAGRDEGTGIYLYVELEWPCSPAVKPIHPEG